MSTTVIGADWPLIGRDEELALLRELRNGSPSRSAIVIGPPGVGKTRLAREALNEASLEGWSTLSVQGVAGMSGVPLGPFRTAFRIPKPEGPEELTESVLHELQAARSSAGLFVVVDDCHYLDDASIALLHQSMATGSMTTLMTIRTGETPQPSLTDIWKDRVAERIELFNLSRKEAGDLVMAGLGGPVQDSSSERIWHLTSGNPLYLREAVLSGAETGALKVKDGTWRWSTGWASGSRLQELVTSRLGRLDADETSAAELLAVAGALPLDLLLRLTSADVVERLETKGLVTTQRTVNGLEVSMASPLQTEVLRSNLPALRQRSLRHTLVDTLLAQGVRTSADRVRIANWSLELGLDVDPISLSLGSNAALYRIGTAIARRVQEILPDVKPAQLENPSVAQDNDVAIALARAAFARTGGLVEGVALASSLAWVGATADAEHVLGTLADGAEGINDKIRVALALSWIQFWIHFDVESARETLTDVLAVAEFSDCDSNLVAQIYESMAGHALNTAQPKSALDFAERSAKIKGVELHASVGAPAAAASLAFLGRCDESLALIDLAVPLVMGADQKLEMVQLLVARAGALARTGDVETARELVQWIRDVALAEGLLDATGALGAILGEILLRQGRPNEAARVFGDSCGLLAERDQLGYRPWAMTGLARARALAGEDDLAKSALEDAFESRTIVRQFEMAFYLAEVAVHRVMGRLDLAAQRARDGAEWAKGAGMVVDEAMALEELLRLEPTADVAERLRQLTTVSDSRLVEALARFARAAVDSDPDELVKVSQVFAAMTTWPLAIDAAEVALHIFEHRGDTRGAQSVSRTISGLRTNCEGLYSLLRTSDGTQLTRRESEIARLAVAGRTTREIAERLFLSPRTVENHLYHVYTKLGVTNRRTLAQAIETTETE